MKTTFKYLYYLCFTAALLFSGSLSGQNRCYEDLMQQGREAMGKNNFEEAIRSFQSIIRNCDRATAAQRSEAISSMNQAFEKIRATLRAETEKAQEEEHKAIASEKEAKKEAKLKEIEALKSESSRIAFLASLEKETPDKLSLAFLSKKMLDTIAEFSQAAEAAFGDAIQERYAKIQQSASGYINDVLIMPDERLIYAIEGNLFVQLADGNVKTIPAHQDHIVAMTPFGNGFITVSRDHKARMWGSEGEPLQVLTGHRADVNFALTSPDQSLIVTGSRDSTAIIWSDAGGLLHQLQGHAGQIYAAAFSPDGGRLITRATDQRVKLWSAKGENIATLQHDAYIYDALFSPDGQTIITCSADQTIRIWDLKGQAQKTLSEHQGAVFSLELSPDGRHFLSTSADETAILWSLDGKVVKKFESTLGSFPSEDAEDVLAPIRKAVFAPDGNKILTAYGEGMQLIDYHGRVQTSFRHAAPVTQMIFSPNGKFLLSGAQDNAAKLWDLEGRILLNLNPFQDHIIGLNFSADGDHALAYSKDGMLTFCPTPDYIYKQLEQNPPEVSKQTKAKYNLGNSAENKD